MNYIRFIHLKKGSADPDVVPFALDYPHPLFSYYTFNRRAFIYRILVSSEYLMCPDSHSKINEAKFYLEKNLNLSVLILIVKSSFKGSGTASEKNL